MTLALRDYQQSCLESIRAGYRSGVRRQLVCLPTGTGKTVVFAGFPRFFGMKRRMLVLAHREELLSQACDKIRRANADLVVDVEQASRHASDDAQVVVASVPTLGRRNSRRLARLDPNQFNLIVVDEAHHATAESYRRVLDYFGVFAPDTRKLLVGFTATPKRGDGQGLDAVFQQIVFSRTLPEMVLENWLAPVAGWRVETDVDISSVRSRMGDFVASQLSASVNVAERNQMVVDVHRKLLAERKTLCFCVDVAHATALAEAFRQEGIAAGCVTGSTDSETRRQVLADFSAGHLQVLTNCMVLTEGYDEPSVSGIILARPTKSALLYTQMIGRGTRLHPDKRDLLVVDVVDLTRDHRLVTLPGLFGLGQGFDMEGRTTGEVERALQWTERNRPWVRTDLATSLSDLRYRCNHVNLLDLELPDELLDVTDFAWTAAGAQHYRLSVGNGATVSVSATILGAWELLLRRNGREETIANAPDAESAIRLADEYVTEKHPDAVGLVKRDTRWRMAPATEKQLAVLESRGMAPPRGLTKGQASHLIALLGRKRRRVEAR